MAELDDDEDVSQNKTGKTLVGVTADALNISEVGILLRNYVTEQQGYDPNYQVHPMLQSVLAYSDRFGAFKNKDATITVREALINKHLHDCEFSCISNLVPETADEARTLHPELKRLPEEELQELLDDLAKLKKYE